MKIVRNKQITVITFFIVASVLFEFSRTFFQGIYSLYYLERTLTIADVTSIKIFQIIAWMIFEIPCGYLADRFGRMKIFLLSNIIAIISFIVLANATTYFQFASAEFIYGIAFAANSGTLLSFINHIFQNELKTEIPAKVFGFITVGTYTAAFTSGSIGIYLYGKNISLPFYVSAIAMLILFFLIILFMKIMKIKDNKSIKKKILFYNKDFINNLKNVFTSKIYTKYIAFYCLFVALSQGIYQYWPIILTRDYNINKQLAFTAMIIGTIIGGLLYSILKIKIKIKIIIATFLLGIPLIILAGNIKHSSLPVILFFISQIGRGMVFSLLGNFSNIIITDQEEKTTILSVSGTLVQISSIIFLLIFSNMANIFTITEIWICIGIGYVLLNLINLNVSKNDKLKN